MIRSGFVSIIGLPNSGKSTYLNAVLKENIAITSRKPQTTRRNLKGIYNDDDSQIVFVDTPGVNTGKAMLDKYMEKSVSSSLSDIDLLIIMIDVNTYKVDKFDKLISVIRKSRAPKVIIINKIDAYEGDIDAAKEEIKIIFSDVSEIKEIFCISALKKKNIKEVIVELKKYLKDNCRYYDTEFLTDEPTKKIVADMIRQQCLYKLDKEVPHSIEVVVESMKMSKSKCMQIEALIVCDKEAHKKIIIGKNGVMIKNIGIGSRISIEKFLDEKVNLKLNVIVKENWRNEKTKLINFGYDIDNI